MWLSALECSRDCCSCDMGPVSQAHIAAVRKLYPPSSDTKSSESEAERKVLFVQVLERAIGVSVNRIMNFTFPEFNQMFLSPASGQAWQVHISTANVLPSNQHQRRLDPKINNRVNCFQTTIYHVLAAEMRMSSSPTTTRHI